MPGPRPLLGQQAEWGRDGDNTSSSPLGSFQARGSVVWPELEAMKAIHAACFPIARKAEAKEWPL